MSLNDIFDGDNARLIESIEALIALNDEDAIRPHGIGGHARKLLSSAAVRLSALQSTTRATQPEAAMQDLLAAIDAWAIDPSADAEQRILDARAALKDHRHG